jgi:tetratricopeptide (TPR) repeat protein
MTLAEVGRARDGVAVLEPIAASGDPDTLAALGFVLSEAGDQARARRVLESVFEHDPRHPVASMHLALVAVRERRFAEAERHARRALDQNPGLAPAWNLLAVAAYDQGRREEALDAWDRGLRLAPDDFDALYNLALVAAEAGQRERAIAALRRFVAEAPAARYGPDLVTARARLRALEAQ